MAKYGKRKQKIKLNDEKIKRQKPGTSRIKLNDIEWNE